MIGESTLVEQPTSARKISRHIWRISPIFIGLSLLAICGISVREAYLDTKLVAKQSAQSALFKEMIEQLEEYKAEHGGYPDKLDVLKYQYFDGGDPSLLNLFQYKTDGATYSISSIGVATHSELSAHSTQGKPHIEWGKSATGGMP